MALNAKHNKAALKDWLTNTIDQDFARRMVTPLAEQELFLLSGGVQAPFPVVVLALKYGCTQTNDRGDLTVWTDTNFASDTQNLEERQVLSSLTKQSRNQAIVSPVRLFAAALIELETGCFTLSREEYNALQQGIPEGFRCSEQVTAHELMQPKADVANGADPATLLKSVSYEDFMAAVKETLQAWKIAPKIPQEAYGEVRPVSPLGKVLTRIASQQHAGSAGVPAL